MPTNTRCFSSFGCVALLLLLGTAPACRTKHRGVHYSPMQVVGTSRITLVVDSLPFDPRAAPHPFYLELMTAKDTYLVRPTTEELSFPALTDSLTQVKLYYNDWHGSVQGAALQRAYASLYFPNRPATIVIDTYPFHHPVAKKWLKQQQDRVYCEIRFPQSERFFVTALVQDQRVVQ